MDKIVSLANEVMRLARDHFPKCGGPMTASRLVSHQVTLGQIFDSDNAMAMGEDSFAVRSGQQKLFRSFGIDAPRTTGKKQSHKYSRQGPEGIVHFVRRVGTSESHQ
jgi:hypothetical protein